MKIKRNLMLFFLLVVILLPNYVTAYSPQDKKDPMLAAAFSWFTPGLGQAYVGNYLEGGLYWVVDRSLLWSAILTIADIKINLNSDVGLGFSINLKKNPSKARIWTSVGLGLGFVAFHIYQIIDASADANYYNKKKMANYYKKKGFSLMLNPETSGLAYSIQF